jgi:uncharacterized protein
MAFQFTYPGVYVEERKSGVTTITGVSTSVALLVGMADRGPSGVPTPVRTITQFETLFGDNTAYGEMVHQVRQFFLNGGTNAIIMRVVDAAALASAITLRSEGHVSVLDVSARDIGEAGDTIRVEADYNTSSPEMTFNLTAYRRIVDDRGRVTQQALESFRNLTMDPAGGRFAPNVVNVESALIRLGVNAGINLTTLNGNGFSRSGLLVPAADDAAAFNTLSALVTATSNRIAISVDGDPIAEVVLPATAANLAGLLAEWQAAIRNRLASEGQGANRVNVTVEAGPGGRRQLQVTSNGGKSVEIFRTAQNDAASPLQLGVAQGGIEIGRFSRARPAPNGFVTRINQATTSSFANNSNLARINAFADANKASITDLEIDDASVATAGGPLTVGGIAFTAGTRMAEGTLSAAGEGSFLNVAESLDTLRTHIENIAGASWTVRRDGLRLALYPKFGDSDVDMTAVVHTSNPAAPGTQLDIGAAGQIAEAARAANVAAYSLGGNVLGYQLAPVGGNNGGVPAPSDYANAYPIVDKNVDIFNLMMLPRGAGQTDAQRVLLWGAASAFARDRWALLIVDPPSEAAWRTVDEAAAGIAALRTGVATSYAAIYWSRVRVVDDTGIVIVDPAGTVAGVMARTDTRRGVWKAPAGLEASMINVRGLEHTVSDRENGVTNPLAINTLRVFATGAVVWGSRTMAGFDNSGEDDYKYVPVRRLALMIEESLYRGLRFAVFEPNDYRLWGQIRLAAGAFMQNLFRQGAFQGAKASEAYQVICDETTTTQNDINLGVVNVVVKFAPLKPAEFVTIIVTQLAGQVQT